MSYDDVLKKHKGEIRDIVIDYRTNEATIIFKRGGGIIAESPESADRYISRFAKPRR